MFDSHTSLFGDEKESKISVSDVDIEEPKRTPSFKTLEEIPEKYGLSQNVFDHI